MPLWHSHSYTEFSIPIKELHYPKLNKKIINSYTSKDILPYSTILSYNSYLQEPYPTNAIVKYLKCKCGHYKISIHDGSTYTITFDPEFLRITIEYIKKQKEEEEINRLLKLGNPDYEKLIDSETIINEYKSKLQYLQEQLDITKQLLNSSITNNKIWNNIPNKVKQSLFKKYGKNLNN